MSIKAGIPPADFSGSTASPTSELFPTLEVAIAVLAFVVLAGVGMWYQRKLHGANSKPLAVDKAKEVEVGDMRT
jgi:hypothetical protein